jgi:thymidylate synthase
MNFNKEWLNKVQKIHHHGKVEKPRGMETKALYQETIEASMRYPVLTLPTRKLSYQFMAAEAYWILSGDDTVAGIEPFNKHIAKFSDDGERFFGAYGPKIISQIDYVVDTLIDDPDSRQAGLTIWRENPGKSKDIPCTVAVFAGIRDKTTLDLSVYMRSSDVWLGLPYDVFNFSMLGHLICAKIAEKAGLQYEPGVLRLTAANMHMYKTNENDSLDVVFRESPPYGNEVRWCNEVPHLFHSSEKALMDNLKNLRTSKPGDAQRWWEKQ